VAAGDVNHDDIPDLVVANRDSRSVSVLLNTGGGASSVGTRTLHAGFRMDPPFPNPSRDRVRVRFAIPTAERITAEVFDTQGRKVRVIGSDTRPAGSHVAVWDGRDAAGVPVSSGMFFIRVSAGGVSRVAPVVVLR
jgi:hypothetical protein